MNDDDMLAAMRSSLTGVKDSLGGVHMDRPAEAITARARGRRLRRGLTGAGAAGAALGVSLALALSGGPAAARPVHVNLAAWSVNTTGTGLVELTVRRLEHLDELRQALADAGVPAKVTFREACTGRLSSSNVTPTSTLTRASGSDLAIDTAAIPAGSELLIGIAEQQLGRYGLGFSFAIGLVKNDAPVTCSPFVPELAPATSK
jgi:hypothetical protein